MRKDYLSHFIAGWAIAMTCCLFAPPLFAAFAGIGFGIAWETIHDDLLQRGEPELADALWTAAGAICAALFYLIFSGGCV